MCGRYAYYTSSELISSYSLLSKDDPQTKLALNLPDNYNVAPGSHMPVIIRGAQECTVEFMLWGLVPSWSKTPDTKLKLINARAENLLEKPMWRNLVKSKRCIVPARGFYEWKRLPDGTKQPYYISLKNEDVMSFAGLWDEWHDEQGTIIISYSIITTTPSKEMANVHKRMPAILNESQMKRWLEPTTIPESELKSLLHTSPNNSLEIVKVSREVNNASNNSEELIYRLDD